MRHIIPVAYSLLFSTVTLALEHGTQDFDDANTEYLVSLLEQDFTQNPESNYANHVFTSISDLENKFNSYLLSNIGVSNSRSKREAIEVENIEDMENELKRQLKGKTPTFALVIKIYLKLCLTLRRKEEKRIKDMDKDLDCVIADVEACKSIKKDMAVGLKNHQLALFLYKLNKKNMMDGNPEILHALMYKVIMKSTSSMWNMGGGESNFDRTLTCPSGACSVPLAWSDIYGYGCWCNFRESISHGYGTPMDEYDDLCKTMQFCSRCIEIDEENAGNSCDLATTEYEINLSISNAGVIGADCDGDNAGDVCAIGLCKCDLQFHTDLVSILNQGSPPVISEPFKHSEGFDRLDNNNCARFGFGSGKSLECCGEAPSRRPFNPFVNDCCANSVESFGSC